MRNVSASQIKLYRQCRQQYYDRYILQIPSTQDTSGLLGTGIHKAIELYYAQGKNPLATFSKVVRDTLNNWQDDGTPVSYYYSYSQIVDQGTEILSTFNFEQFRPKINELAFEVPFYDMCKMRGFIDMVTEDGGIIDFKSAKRKPKDLNNDPQFMVYYWAYFQKFGEKPAYVRWYHLRTHEVFDFTFDWNRFDSVVVDTVKEMVTDDYADLTGAKCSNCAPWCFRNKSGT